MRKCMVTLCLMFSLTAPLKFVWNYVINTANCVVEYGSEWGQLTLKTSVCAFNKMTFQGA